MQTENLLPPIFWLQVPTDLESILLTSTSQLFRPAQLFRCSADVHFHNQSAQGSWSKAFTQLGWPQQSSCMQDIWYTGRTLSRTERSPCPAQAHSKEARASTNHMTSAHSEHRNRSTRGEQASGSLLNHEHTQHHGVVLGSRTGDWMGWRELSSNGQHPALSAHVTTLRLHGSSHAEHPKT